MMCINCDFDYCFCFKQKTAYDMRMSDWSSDVCSSDLTTVLGYQRGKRSVNGTTGGPFRAFDYDFSDRVTQKSIEARLAGDIGPANWVVGVYGVNRSAEHTSELQSLMRISYAVFCLKTKKTNKQSILAMTGGTGTGTKTQN